MIEYNGINEVFKIIYAIQAARLESQDTFENYTIQVFIDCELPSY